MLLLTVPIETVPMDGEAGKAGVRVRRPALGAFQDRSWSQATSHRRPARFGLTRVAVDVTEDEAATIPGAVIETLVAGPKECARWARHAATAHPKYGEYKQKVAESAAAIRADIAARRKRASKLTRRLITERETLNADLVQPWHKSVLEEKHHAIRAACKPLDRKDMLKDLGEEAAKLLPSILMAMLLGQFGPSGIAFAATVISSDGFSGSGELNGATMDAASGGSANVWAALANGQWSQGSGDASCVGAGAGFPLFDTTMADVTDGDVDYVFSGGTQAGSTIRANGTTGLGYAFVFNTTNWKIFRWDGGATYTQIGSNSLGSATAGDVANITATGTTIGGTVNGGSSVSGTDATYATGRFGIHAVVASNSGTLYIGRQASGGSAIKTVNGLAIASVKTINGVAIANVKTIMGLA